MRVDESIYEVESYWRDGAPGTGRGEWDPYGPIHHFMQGCFRFERLLDVGCGCGPFVRFGEAGRTFGLDFSRYGVEHPLPGAEGKITYGEICDIPFKDDFFDVVTAFNMMEHVKPSDVPAALDELFRVSSKWVVLMTCVASDYEPYLEYDYIGDAIENYSEKIQHEIKRGHWCVRPRDWWLEKIGVRGVIDPAKEKEILDFTTALVGATDKQWTYKSEGLFVFRKAGR